MEEEGERKRKLYIEDIAILLIAIVLVGGVVYLKFYKAPTQVEEENGLQTWLKLVASPEFNQATRPVKNNLTYGCMPDLVLSELPALPKDFYNIRALYRFGQIKNVSLMESRITPEYWAQPDFNHVDYETNIVPVVCNPGGGYVAWCIDVTPFKKGLFINKSSTLAYTGKFWITSGALVREYEGVGIEEVSYPEYAKLEASSMWGGIEKEVYQNSAKSAQYITADFSFKELEGNEVVSLSKDTILAPSFPIYRWGYDKYSKYAKEVEEKIVLSPDIPTGDYVVAVRIYAPSQEFTQAQLLKYGLGKYTDPNTGEMSCGPKIHYIFITVVD